MTRPAARALATATVLVGMLAAMAAVARTAHASPDLLLDGQQIELAGTVRFRDVRLLNGSRIVVTPFQGAGTNTGRLEVLAHRILVDATSAIDASGAGYRGLSNADGEGNGGGKGAAVSSDATGGGGHGARGGAGVLLAGCGLIPGALGGDVAIAGLSDVTFGGAGSAAGTADGDDGGKGGNGGGAILLRASRIDLDGLLVADGLPGLVFHDDAAGGGAGGGLLVQASAFAAFAGVLRANGAPGGLTTKDEGGGGGGGELRLFVNTIPPDLTISLSGAGGVGCPAAAGQGSLAPAALPPGCLDLDGDGFESAECGGTDCDDSDAQVHLGALEHCNGVDDDCSGVADDHGAEQSCDGGTCSSGACAPPEDGGADAHVVDASERDATSPPDAAADAATDQPQPEGADAAASATDASGLDGDESEGARAELRGGCAVSSAATEMAPGWILLMVVLAVLGVTVGRRRD